MSSSSCVVPMSGLIQALTPGHATGLIFGAMTVSDGKAVAATYSSLSNPILHATDRWGFVPGEVLHKTAQIQGAVETGFPTSECN